MGMRGHGRKLIILLAIVSLVLLNIWRWWPDSHSSSVEKEQSTGAFDPKDFELRAISVDSLPPMPRDIFHPKKPIVKPRPVTPPVVVKPVPVLSPEEIARNLAQTEFLQIRCVGVSARNDRMQAYLISAGEPVLVSNGDQINGRFVVEKISLDGVSLRDPSTDVGGFITVSGGK